MLSCGLYRSRPHSRSYVDLLDRLKWNPLRPQWNERAPPSSQLSQGNIKCGPSVNRGKESDACKQADHDNRNSRIRTHKVKLIQADEDDDSHCDYKSGYRTDGPCRRHVVPFDLSVAGHRSHNDPVQGARGKFDDRSETARRGLPCNGFGTPNMSVNLWGASPLYENGN